MNLVPFPGAPYRAESLLTSETFSGRSHVVLLEKTAIFSWTFPRCPTD